MRVYSALAGVMIIAVSTNADAQTKHQFSQEEKIYVFCSWAPTRTSLAMTQIEEVIWKNRSIVLPDGSTRQAENLSHYLDKVGRSIPTGFDYPAECTWSRSPGYPHYEPNSSYRAANGATITTELVKVAPEKFAAFDWVKVTSLPTGRPAKEDAEPTQRAVKDTPSTADVASREDDRARRRAEFDAKLAEYERQKADHERQLREREEAIAEQNAKADAAKAAAAAKLAQHEREMAEYRERLAQRERDAAAVRAEWGTRAAAASDTVTTAEQTEIRQVKSLMLSNSEAAALKSLLENNGARNGPNWAPITNIRCSTVIDLGKQKWICTGEQARVRRPTTASGQ